MQLKLNHIGIAVSNVEALKKLFALLGMGVEHSEAVPDQGVQTHFLPLSIVPGQAHFEFLEVTDPEGTVAKFIEKRGPGIHHLSFTVPAGELETLCERLRSEGYRLIYDRPRSGAHGMRINFLHPASAGGMLIEIMEPDRSAGS